MIRSSLPWVEAGRQFGQYSQASLTGFEQALVAFAERMGVA